jgi:hypothetical protein
MGIPSTALLLLMAAPILLQNGNFKQMNAGKPAGWSLHGDCRVLSKGGLNGHPAIELVSTGQGTSEAVQLIKPEPPRRGAFVVKAWMRCDEVGEGGDCCLWVDVIQDGGPPLWAQLGLPNRESRQWQQVSAEVRPTYPVKEVWIHLILRNVKGRVRFSNVTLESIPFEIKELRLYAEGNDQYQLRASISENVDWQVEAVQYGKQIWQSSGSGIRISDKFKACDSNPVKVTVTATLNESVKRKSVTVRTPKSVPKLDWWVADSFTRVFQDDVPPERASRQVNLEMARGEYESFQICLRSTIDLSRVDVMPSGLRSSAYNLSSDLIDWYRVGYVWVETPFAHPFSPRRSSEWWPDPLLPAREFKLESGITQPLWFTVRIPPDTPPGDYAGHVAVSVDGESAISVPTSIRVHSVVIPTQGYMKTAFALMDWHLKKVYGNIDPKLRRAYTDFLLDHRLNPDDISRTNFPDIKELEYANKRGLNAFNILNVVPEPKDDSGWVCWAPVEAYTPEFKRRFFQRLDEFVPELEKRGLIDKAYVYGFDERGPEYIPIIKDYFGEIKRRYPRIRTLSTCWPPAGTDPLSLNIDWYVSLSSSYNHELAQKVRKKGGEMWWYVCMGPNYPYANWLLENPLIEARVIWWQAFSYDVEGFLYWGLNIWERKNNDKPISSSAGPRLDWSVTTGGNYNFLNGDGVLLYPGENGPIGSMRLANIRDGLEDTELLRQYKERFGRKSVESILAPATIDRMRYTREPNVLLKSRLKMLRSLSTSR